MAAGMQSGWEVQQCWLKNANQNSMHPATRQNNKNQQITKCRGVSPLANYPQDKPFSAISVRVEIIMSERTM